MDGDRQMDDMMDGQINGSTDGCIDEQIGGWLEGLFWSA